MRGLGQLDVQPMLDFVLVLKSACGCSCGSEGGKEDTGGRGEGRELACPGGGIARHEVGEFGWGRAASSWRSATGDGVNAGYSGVGDKAGEDMGALSVIRLSSGSRPGMFGKFATSRLRSFACRMDTYHHPRTTDQCGIHHVCISGVAVSVDVRRVCTA